MHNVSRITLNNNNSLQGFLSHAELPKALGVYKEEIMTPGAHALNALVLEPFLGMGVLLGV